MAFEWFLRGKGPMPIEHYYGRLSEEFGGALPDAIIRAQQRLPIGFLEQVLEYRSYVDARKANEVDPKGWESSEMRRIAQEIEAELAAEEMPSNG